MLAQVVEGGRRGVMNYPDSKSTLLANLDAERKWQGRIRSVLGGALVELDSKILTLSSR